MLVYLFLCSIVKLGESTYVNGEQADWSTKISQRNSGVQGPCPGNSHCVLLQACPVYANILNYQCVDTNRLGGLICGSSERGAMICCPLGYIYTSGWHSTPSTPNYPSVGSGLAGVGTGSGNIPGKDERTCGKPVVQGENYQGIGAFPFVVRIGFRNVVTGEIKYPCAGSILNKRVILTAAHCALAKAENYKLFSVRVGEWRTDSTLDCGDEFCALPIQDIALSHVIVHPGYEQRTFKNDVALLVLRADINYTVTAQPICIVDSWSQPSNQAILVGWGRAAGQQVQSPLQQAIELPVVSVQQCINVYSRTIPVTNEHLCAGGQFGRDACEGFGGAPLLVKHSGSYYQVGILSFGSNQCGATGVPSVYANVKIFSQWIKENTPVIYS